MAGFLALITGVAGCASRSPTVSYYTLSPEAASAEAAVLVAGAPVAVAVGPADFPRALRRSRLATRSGPNQIEFDEFSRWAGSLESDFLGAIGANLQSLLGSSRVSVYPNVAEFPADYRVRFEVRRFDADADGMVTLQTRWTLRGGGDDPEIHTGDFSQTQAATGTGPAAVVAAHSELVGALSRRIAEQIRRSASGN